MPIKTTLFGIFFYNYRTLCGCMKYACNDYSKCLKEENVDEKIKRYSEIFYLEQNYTGKLFYKNKKNKIYSDITIFNKDFSIILHEKLSTFNNTYNFTLNSNPIIFNQIPKEILAIINKKNIILPKH